MSAGSHELTALQRDVLRGFFEREAGFFLTGGAALVGYYLHHRETMDLDLFAMDAEAFERGRYALTDAAASLGASVEVRQAAPGFERLVVSRGDESLVVDLVLERVAQVHPDKQVFAGVRVDPIEEIVANKLTTIVSRAEERDLVDLYWLERAGYRAEDFLAAALRKDGSATPATIAWLLSETRIPDGAKLPGDLSAEVLREWVEDLVGRLARAAVPPAR